MIDLTYKKYPALQTTALLDGAMGSALRDRGVDVPNHTSSIWSAQALLSAPQEITQLHRDYIEVGADIITTNTYAVTPSSLARKGLQHRLEELLVLACELAAEALGAQQLPTKIAGSLPPLQISYRADLVEPFDELLPHYRFMASVMAPHVDLFLCETMTSSVEARAASQAALETDTPVWVSFALEDSGLRLRGGETITQACTSLRDLPIAAFLINCSSSHAVTHGLTDLAVNSQVSYGAYANPFRHEPPVGEYGSDNPDFLDESSYANVVAEWVEAGATIVGGCCGTNPSYIRAIKDRLTRSVSITASE